MREKNSERPDTRDNRSKNSTKTGKKNTKNREFAVITYSFLALFICLMGYFSYFQFFKSEEFINNPYNTRQETFAQKIVRGQILTNDGQVLAETVTDSEGNETRTLQIFRLKKETLAWCSKAMRFSRQCQSMTTLRLE